MQPDRALKNILLYHSGSENCENLLKIFGSFQVSHRFHSTTKLNRCFEILNQSKIELVIFHSHSIGPDQLNFLNEINKLNSGVESTSRTGCLCIINSETDMKKIESSISLHFKFSFIIAGNKNLDLFRNVLIKEANRYLITIQKPAENLVLPTGKRTTKPENRSAEPAYEIISFGASTGGPKAISQILPELCRGTDLPIVVVVHMPVGFTKEFAKNLNSGCSHEVLEATHNIDVKPGKVYVAPSSHHLICNSVRGQKILQTIKLGIDTTYKPSVDLFLRSVSGIYGGTSINVILTGMGDDGLQGARCIREKNGKLLVQDENSSVVWGMPGVIAKAGLEDKILPLNKIASEIVSMVKIRNLI